MLKWNVGRLSANGKLVGIRTDQEKRNTTDKKSRT